MAGRIRRRRFLSRSRLERRVAGCVVAGASDIGIELSTICICLIGQHFGHFYLQGKKQCRGARACRPMWPATARFRHPFVANRYQLTPFRLKKAEPGASI